MSINYEEKLRDILLNKNKDNIITEQDPVAGDKKFSEKKELSSEDKVKETEKEKKDNAENIDDMRNMETDSPQQGVNRADPRFNDGYNTNPIDDTTGEFGYDNQFDTYEVETIETLEKHKRVKLMEYFEEMRVQIENFKTVLDNILIQNITEIENSVLGEIVTSLEKLEKKVNYYMVNGFNESKYEKVLYVFSHLRSELLIISKLVNKVLLLNKKDKNKEE